MVQFGALLERTKVDTFDEEFRGFFVDYEELKRVLERPGVTSAAFERSLDGEVEKAALFACGRIGDVAEVLRRGGDVAAARRAMASLLATLRFVELNLVAVRKIVKKRDKFAARGGFQVVSLDNSEEDVLSRRSSSSHAPQQQQQQRRLGSSSSSTSTSTSYGSMLSSPTTAASYDVRRRRINWLLCAERSRHLECLESFEPQFAALLASARAVRESRKKARDVVSTKSESEAPVSMMGALIATGDAADARALADLLDSCEAALASAKAARRDLRHHAAAMTAVGVDAEFDYARSLSSFQGGDELKGGDEASFLARAVANLPHLRRDRFAASSSFAEEPDTSAEKNFRAALAAQCSAAALYAASCYAIAPTAHAYAAAVGEPAAFAGILLAAAPLASLAARAVADNASRRYPNLGFKPPVILGGALCCAGNLLYCLGPRLRSSAAALVARFAIGFSGGADAVNRRYIGTVLPSDRGLAAARYVASDAVGVALGLLLAASCATPGHRQATLPSLVLAACWAVHGVLVALVWREVPVARRRPFSSTVALEEDDDEDEALLSSRKVQFLESGLSDDMDSSATPRVTRRVLSDISSSRRRQRPTSAVVTTPYRAALGRLMVSGVVRELLLVSSSRLAARAFDWSPRISGATLCALRLSSLPSTGRVRAVAEALYDERVVSLACGTTALVAVAVLATWPALATKGGAAALGLWLAASFAAFSAADAMAVADQHLVVKLAPAAESQTAPHNANVLARVAADLLFAASSLTHGSLCAANAALWAGPAAALALATLSTFPCCLGLSSCDLL